MPHTFSKLLLMPIGTWGHQVDVPVSIVTVVVGLLYVMVVMGLIPTMSIPVVGLRSV